MKGEFSLEAKIYGKVWGKHDYASEVKFLNSLFHKHGCRSILDIGCGTGNHSIRLCKLGYKVTGIDISPAVLKIARQKDEEAKIKFVQADVKNLEKIVLKEQKFDAAICLGQVLSS